MPKTKTEKLESAIVDIRSENLDEIRKLERQGPRGGCNAATIDGWIQSPHGTISKACNKLSDITMNHWDGHRRTPTVAIPLCIYVECVKAYNQIFHGELK